jgi:ATPase subunit of ABC transporter with duplicated ATPase domains
MIKRIYVNNFRCLVAFEAEFDSFGVLCGPNGAGKSSVFDALRLIKNLATGDGVLGGEGERDIPYLEFTRWQKGSTQESAVQEFELDVTVGGQVFEYVVHIEQKASFEKPRIVKESARCNEKPLFERDLDGVRFQKSDGSKTGFPLDWRQAALASIQPRGNLGDLALLQQAIAKILILRPNPRGMERESRAESKRPDSDLANLTSWYRVLSAEQEWTDMLRESLRQVWSDFKAFKMEDVGLNTKALQLRFDATNGSDAGLLFFHQLSDGEKALLTLYMIHAALGTGAVQTVLIDEPDNFVGLAELQPWVLSMRELLDRDHQALLISHHPEILSNAGADSGRYLWRDSHTSPTRIGPLKIPDGLSAGEAVARGWAGA